MKHSTSLPMLLLVLGLAVVCQDLALATVYEPWGSPGGEYFRADCPKGSYLVGLDGKAGGGWIASPRSVLWLPANRSLARRRSANITGRAEEANRQTICLGAGINNRAVQSWTVEILRSDNKFVQVPEGTAHRLDLLLPRRGGVSARSQNTLSLLRSSPCITGRCVASNPRLSSR